MKFKNHYNFDPNKGKEKTDSKSMTVPNMTMPLSQILERYTRGHEMPMKTGQYHGEEGEEFDAYSKLDKLEKLDLANEIRQSIRETQQTIKTPKTGEAKSKPSGREEVRLDDLEAERSDQKPV